MSMMKQNITDDILHIPVNIVLCQVLRKYNQNIQCFLHNMSIISVTLEHG